MAAVLFSGGMAQAAWVPPSPKKSSSPAELRLLESTRSCRSSERSAGMAALS